MTLAAPAAFAAAVWEVARKEVQQHVRTKRLLIIGPLFLLAVILVTIVFPMLLVRNQELRDVGMVVGGLGSSVQNLVLVFFVSGFFFLSGFFYVQLVPILLTADAVCSEWSNRTLFLLLSKPVSRAAFVVGKFVGSVLTVAGLLVSVLGIDYLVLQVILPGHSTGSDVARFAGGLGILVLGAMAWAALSLLMSTLTKSAIMANLLTIMMWIIVLPLLARLDFFIALATKGITGAFTNPPHWASYLSPSSSMTVATNVFSPATGSSGLGLLGSVLGVSSQLDPWGAVVALLVQTALFLGLSMLVVQRRNFE